MNDLNKFAHLKPDLNNAEYIIFIGMSPAQAGNPFKLQARQLATARTDGNLQYTIVTPSLPAGSSSLAAGDDNNWLPIKPASDSALVLGMIQWIINNERFNKTFLAQPGINAMKQAGTAHWCNASHLVISDDNHSRNGCFLRASDMNMPFEGSAYSDTDHYVIVDAKSDDFGLHTQATEATLFVDRDIIVADVSVRVKSSLQRLKEEAFKHDLSFYSQQCEISEADIINLATRFTSFGTKAVVDTHGGNMHSNGFYNTFTILMLNALIGNVNLKGGAMAKAGRIPTSKQGPSL